jgi:hypothetical protein
MQTLPSAPDAGNHESASNTLLGAALQYAGRGWRVIPLHSPTSQGCSCGKHGCKCVGKHPRTPHGSKDASTEAVKIRTWWQRWPEANIAIATGPESGLWVLDVDGEEGKSSLKLLEAQERLPRTFRAFTGRRGLDGDRAGFHLYFTWPSGASLRNSAGLLGKGLDIRGNGGYVVAPPSLHASGLRYEWEGDESAVAVPPTWLIDQASKNTVTSVSMLGTKAVYKGERREMLYRIAARWRRDGAAVGQLETRLRALNLRLCVPPVEDELVLKAAHSAARHPVGGLDPLDSAYEKVQAESHWYSYDKFLAVIRHLEAQRPGYFILLPVERIGKLIGCDPRLVGRHRKRAIAEGVIQEVEKYIPHQRSTRFKVLTRPSQEVSH